jgi:chromosome segregation ATPase
MSKRHREGTPMKESKIKHLQDKMGKDLETKIANLTGALGNVKGDKIKDLKDSFIDVMKKFVVPVIEAHGTLVSDLISQIIELESRVEETQDELVASKERVKDLENCREKSDVKLSRKEMTEKVAASARQFKILDVDFGKEMNDR